MSDVSKVSVTAELIVPGSVDIVAEDYPKAEVNTNYFTITGQGVYNPDYNGGVPDWLNNYVQTTLTDGEYIDANSLLNQLASLQLEIENGVNVQIVQVNTNNSITNARIDTVKSEIENDFAVVIQDVNNTVSTKASTAEVDALIVSVFGDENSVAGSYINDKLTTYSDPNKADATTVTALGAAITNPSTGLSATAALTQVGYATVGLNPDGSLNAGAGQIGIIEAEVGDSGARTGLYQEIDVTASAIETNFRYDTDTSIDGVNYNAGFGLVTNTTTGGFDATGHVIGQTYDSEFWINAEKFKFTNTDTTGGVAAFVIDSSGLTPNISFTGTVAFNSVNGAPATYATSYEPGVVKDPYYSTLGLTIAPYFYGELVNLLPYDDARIDFKVIEATQTDWFGIGTTGTGNGGEIFLAQISADDEYLGLVVPANSSAIFHNPGNNTLLLEVMIYRDVPLIDPIPLNSTWYKDASLDNYIYNGTSWVQQINADNIGATGTTTIDGGRIGTGFIEAERLVASDITAGNISSDAIIKGNKIEGALITGSIIKASYIDLTSSGYLTLPRFIIADPGTPSEIVTHVLEPAPSTTAISITALYNSSYDEHFARSESGYYQPDEFGYARLVTQVPTYLDSRGNYNMTTSTSSAEVYGSNVYQPGDFTVNGQKLISLQPALDTESHDMFYVTIKANNQLEYIGGGGGGYITLLGRRFRYCVFANRAHYSDMNRSTWFSQLDEETSPGVWTARISTFRNTSGSYTVDNGVLRFTFSAAGWYDAGAWPSTYIKMNVQNIGSTSFDVSDVEYGEDLISVEAIAQNTIDFRYFATSNYFTAYSGYYYSTQRIPTTYVDYSKLKFIGTQI